MRNFSTNQVRHFFVAGAINANLTNKLDIVFGSTQTGEFFFKYRNADGLLTRTDTIDSKKVRCCNKKAAASLATPLLAHTIAVDTNAVTLSNLVGKTLNCKIQILGAYDGSAYPQLTFNAIVVGDATNTASAAAFHKALAIAIAKAMPRPEKQYPLIKVFSNGTEVLPSTADSAVTGAAAGVVLVEGVQKYVREKLSGDPCHFTVSFQMQDGNMADIVWGKETIAPSAISGNTVVPANYKLADLEVFAAGERGDFYRGAHWPNDIPHTYAIDPFGNTAYDILTIEYFYNGDASDVQKSPKTLQIAGPAAVINSLYSSVMAAIENEGSGSGSGA